MTLPSCCANPATGTLDEKMYQRQLKKGDIAATMMGGGGGADGGGGKQAGGGKFRCACAASLVLCWRSWTAWQPAGNCNVQRAGELCLPALAAAFTCWVAANTVARPLPQHKLSR